MGKGGGRGGGGGGKGPERGRKEVGPDFRLLLIIRWGFRDKPNQKNKNKKNKA